MTTTTMKASPRKGSRLKAQKEMMDKMDKSTEAEKERFEKLMEWEKEKFDKRAKLEEDRNAIFRDLLKKI